MEGISSDRLAPNLSVEQLAWQLEGAMDIKETEAMLVVSVARRLTIPEVRLAALEVAAAIDAEIERCGLAIAGPWLFVSQHLPKDSRTVFDIRFCRPIVDAGGYAGSFTLERLEPIMVASAMHQGTMRTLFTQGYAPLVQDIELSRHAFSGESREIYHQWAGPGGRYHRIEIQFGLAY